MIVSTKGRYALQVMIELTKAESDEYIPLKEIASRQNISRKYLESIMSALSKGGVVDALHGKGGGYRLNKTAAEYRISDILRTTENSLAPVSCVEDSSNPCERVGVCMTFPIWHELNDIINNYLDSITLQDVIDKNRSVGL